MATTPDIQALIAYSGKFEKKLFSTLVNGLEGASDLTVLTGVKNSMNLTKLKVANGARPFSSDFTGDGQAIYSGRKLTVGEGKYELLIDPKAYRETWMSEVMTNGLDPKEVPFAQYLWQQVMLQFAAELNDYTTYFGFDKSLAAAFNAGTAYSAGDYMVYQNDYYLALAATNAGETPVSNPAKWQKVNAEAIAVGLKSIIEEEISNGKIVEEAIGTIDNANVYAHAAFLKLFRSASTPYKRSGIVIYGSFTDVELLMDDIRDQFGKYTEKDMMASEDGSFVLPGTNGKCRVKPVSWLGDSRRLIATPAVVSGGKVKSANLLMGTDLLSDGNKIHTNENLWTIEAGLAMVIGFQIRDLDAIWVNDQE